MIIQTIDTVSAFRDAFRDAGRKDQFSYEGLEALYEQINEVYQDNNYELDVIALCCEFSEYTPDELLKEYSHVDAENIETLVDYLSDNTVLIIVSSGNYIVQGF